MAATAEPLQTDDKKIAVSRIETRALTVCQQAQAFQIVTDQDAVEANSLLNAVINALIREGDELFDPMIAAAFQTHQLALATKKKAVGGLPAAKLRLRNELARYAQLLEDRARQERLRIEKEASDAEDARIEREIEAVETSASFPEDIAAEVKAILEAPRPAFVLPPAAPAMVIPGARDVYKAEVFNAREFFKSIGDGRTPASLASVNQGALDKRAGADKEGFNVPGCRLIKTKSVSSSRG